MSKPLLLQAIDREVLSRPPVWMMRQAGRYMPAYQAVRSKVDFLTLCKTPDLAYEVTCQPVDAFDMDAYIMFCDILIPCEAMGMPLIFNEKGPVLPDPLRTKADIDKLCIPDPQETMGFVMELLKRLRERAEVQHPAKAILGFAGAPWTLATYMVEGGTSRNFTHLKCMMHDQPEALRALLEKCTETVIRYLKAQAQAGAHAVQLFDTWGGMLNEELYQQWALPYQQQIFEALRGMLPTILYVGHAAHLLKYFPQTGATVYSLDPTVTLKQARQVLGHQAVLQGNLDPTWLHCRPDTLTRLVQTMLAEGGDTGYIFNLGHGILPTTPQDHVKLVVELIKHASGAYHAGANTKVSA